MFFLGIYLSFTSNHKSLSLNMFFENGEYLRKVLEPTKDQVMYKRVDKEKNVNFLVTQWSSI